MSDLKQAILELEGRIQVVLDKHIQVRPEEVPVEQWYTSSMEGILTDIQPALEDYMFHRHPSIPPEEWYCRYFNNFHLNLPFDKKRETLRDYLYLPMYDGGEKTYGQFFEDLDKMIELCGIDMESVRDLKSRIEGLKQQKISDLKVREELLNLVFPVYIGLRISGYNESDLRT